jgi:hypothetical protein
LTTVTFSSSGSWQAAAASVDLQAWGEGGSGANGFANHHAGGGGGGGAYAEEPALALTVNTVYSFTIGSGGTGTNTSFAGNSVTVTANAGGNNGGTQNQLGASGGAAGSNTIAKAGGAGAGGQSGTGGQPGGGGGGSAGSGGNGGNASGTLGGSAGSGGGASGGNGGSNGTGSNGNAPGGAGGGGGSTSSFGNGGGSGAAGQISITYTATTAGTAALGGVGTLTATGTAANPGTPITGTISPGQTWLRRFARWRHPAPPGNQVQTITGTTALSGTGTLSAFGGVPAPSVVNQWADGYGQGTTFTSITSALQSVVVGLSPMNSVGPGSGVPTAGNWLFTIVSWTQNPLISNVHVGVGDDIHSWWREFPAAGSGGLTRTSISYTPNIARSVSSVYVAPDMEIAAINVLVIEVAGLNPWDTVAGTGLNYSAGATSLGLSIGAPAQASFFLAGIGGDNTAAGQVFAPGGWTTLATQTQTNGSNHLADNILTSAFLPSSSSSQSVTGTASSAENLSGFALAVYTSGQSPVPAGSNPNWPYVICEAGFGAGYNTPDSEITWTDISARLWHWNETTGIQFQLGELQSTQLEMEMDNNDGALSPSNVGSPYYSNALNANMSFQSGTSPWAGNGNAAIAQSTAFAFASAPPGVAKYSMQVTPDGVTAFPGAISEQVTISGSTAYTASAWFYSPGGYATGAQVAFAWYTSGGAFISFSTSSAVALTAGTWTQVSVTGTSPSNAGKTALILQLSGTPSAAPFYVAEAAFTAGSSVVSTGRVTSGTPVRIRFALGTVGGVAYNRWYVIQRNATQWGEQLTEVRRRYCPVSGTDLWAALSSTPPTFYRSEVYEDAPYAWFPCDDQPGTSGVLPTQLANAAIGNVNTLSVVLSPNGGAAQAVLNANGASGSQFIPPSMAIYTAGALAGWMFGDPQTSPAALESGNPVTATPGSAAWQSSGQVGSTGSYGWFLSCRDTGFPPLSGGITVEGWFNYPFRLSGTALTPSGGAPAPVQQQPLCPLTVLELATDSAPVAVLQLDNSGHLNLITYNGGTGTSNVIYSGSDLRSNNWFMVSMTLTTTAWTVYVNGGATAQVSGTATGMTSAWTYLIANADMGSGGGGSTGGIAHGGNVSVSHLAVYPYALPYYRIMDHYFAAITAFGQLPAPTGVTITWTPPVFPSAGSGGTSTAYAPDGTSGANFGAINGVGASAIVVAKAPGGITSGPSAWVAGSAQVDIPSTSVFTENLFVSFLGLAPSFGIYTASQVGSDLNASTVCGSGDSYSSGYGGSATGIGVCHTASGDGSAYPASPTAIGDSVGERIERLMRAGRCASPNRCIDQSPLLVQAPGAAGGGQQVSVSIQAMAQSDSGLLYVDNLNHLTYWMKTHLASQYSSPVWQLGPSAGKIPYYQEIQWITDPHRVFNVITISPVSPTGAQLPLITPQNATAVNRSQIRHGAQPLQITSWLQSTSEMQSQANWLFSNFGQPQRRIENLKVDAAAYPPAFGFVVGVNIGDIVTVEDWQVGGGGNVSTYRVTELTRRISGGGRTDTGDQADQIAEVVLTCDFEPSSWWS